MQEIKLHDRVIGDILAYWAGETPDSPFIHIGGETYSFGEFYAQSVAIGKALKALGIGRGKRVVMMLPNRIEFLLGWFGTALAGATVVPINPDWKGETLSYILSDAEPTVAILGSDLLDSVRSIAQVPVQPRRSRHL